jgi:hypothetical protein
MSNEQKLLWVQAQLLALSCRIEGLKTRNQYCNFIGMEPTYHEGNFADIEMEIGKTIEMLGTMT